MPSRFAFCRLQVVTIEKPIAGVSEQTLARFARRARSLAQVPGKVNVAVVSSRRVRVLNRSFRGQDKPTDVLSFPALPVLNRDFSGDIVISAEIAVRNARQYGHSAAQEVKVLILHGMLHLAGMDHDADKGHMARTEERLRRELHLSDGLIRRTERGRLASRRRAR